MVKGEKSFFLKPGEELEQGIQDMYVLGDDEGIVLRALEVSSFLFCRILLVILFEEYENVSLLLFY
jgi:hypothetical protein